MNVNQIEYFFQAVSSLIVYSMTDALNRLI